jgi:hypothetical protein
MAHYYLVCAVLTACTPEISREHTTLMLLNCRKKPGEMDSLLTPLASRLPPPIARVHERHLQAAPKRSSQPFSELQTPTDLYCGLFTSTPG